MKQRLKGIILTITASLLFGMLPTLWITAFDGGITVLTMLSLKYILVSAILIPIALWKFNLMSIPALRKIKLLAVTGIFFASQAALYAFSVTLIPVSLAALVLFTYPIFVAILDRFTGGKKLPRLAYWFLVVAFAGLITMFRDGFGQFNLIGLGAVFLAAISFAVYVNRLGCMTKDLPPVVINTFANAGPAISTTFLALVIGQFSLDFTHVTWVYVAIYAVFMGVVAYIAWFSGMKRLGTVETSVISMTEPVFATLISFLVLSQALGIGDVIGIIVCLTGITLFSLAKDGRLGAKAKA